MTPSVLQEPHHCEGPGWTAAVYYGYVILSVHHETPVRKFYDLYNKWMGLDDPEDRT